MDPHEARRLHDDAAQGEAEEAQKAEFHHSRAEAHRRIREGLEALFPELAIRTEVEASRSTAHGAGASVPRGMDAVARVLAETPERWYTVAEVESVLSERGWLPSESVNPQNAIRAAIRRAVAAGIVVEARRGGRVAYRHRSGLTSTADESPENPESSNGHAGHLVTSDLLQPSLSGGDAS